MPPSEPRAALHPRDEIGSVLDRIYERHLTTASGGNLSVRQADGAVRITPAGLDKGELTPADVVRVGPDGAAEGPHRPSSELPFHHALYAARPDLAAIVHAHPVALVAFSACRVVPDLDVLPVAGVRCGRVASVPYERTGTERLGARIADAFAAGAGAALLENHGVVVPGPDLPEAFRRFEMLEWAARVLAVAARLGAPRPAPNDAPPVVAAGPGPGAVPADLADVADTAGAAADAVAAFARRTYARGLTPAAAGAVSARLDGRRFVVTSPDTDRGRAETRDVVVIGTDDVDGADAADAAGAALHRAVYETHPEVHAVITALPVHATAFGVAHRPLEARLVSEAYLVLREVAVLSHHLATTDPDAAARQLGPERPVALVENAGVVTLGRSLAEAFDRLEVLEATAEVTLAAGAVGRPEPLDDDAIRGLRELLGSD